jgi:hypothetical protein
MDDFNITNWRFKHLFKENLEPKSVEEVTSDIEEQPETETSKNENLVDEIGEFWMVLKPQPKDDVTEIFSEVDVFGFALMIANGLKPKDVIGIYIKRSDASRAAKEAIKQRDMNLKEMENAMTAYRESKKEVDNRKNAAKDLINRLK